MRFSTKMDDRILAFGQRRSNPVLGQKKGVHEGYWNMVVDRVAIGLKKLLEVARRGPDNNEDT